MAVVWWWLLACASDPAEPPPAQPTTPAVVDSGEPTAPTARPVDTGDTGDTGSTGGLPQVRCTLQPGNALRVDCTTRLDQPERLTLTTTGAGRTRSWSTAEPTRAATLTAALFPARTEVAWTMHGDASGLLGEGTVTTGPLPADVVTVDQTGTTGVTDHLIVPSGCLGSATVSVVDPEGRVVWFESLPDSAHVTTAVPTADGALAMLLERDRIVELGIDGRRHLDLDTWAVLDRPVHHDLSVQGDHLLVLTAFLHRGTDGRDYVVDGVVVLDRTGTPLATWDLTDWLEPSDGPTEPLSAYWITAFGSAIDWSHANTVQPGPDGAMLVSFRHLHTVVQVRSDPDAADFGAVDWWLSAPRSVVDGGRVLEAAPGFPAPSDFAYQHHATWGPDDRLYLMDNRDPGDGVPSRAVALDVGPRVATLEQAWPLEGVCPFQGGAVALGDGRVWATCATTGAGVELDADGTEHRRAAARCDGTQAHTPRITPWTPPDAWVW